MRIIRNIIFPSIIFFFFIGSLEIVLRTTHMFGARISWSEPDTILGFRFVPGKEYWFFKENDHPITGRINNYGFRDRDWSLEKPRNIYRIAILGDSYIEAFQVEIDRTFLALTENELNKNGDFRKIELMNFGRSGYSQVEELLILKNEVVKFSPDMVILFFLPGNDIQDLNKETATDLVRPFYNLSDSGELILNTDFAKTPYFKSVSFISWFKQHSALISIIAERYNAYGQQGRERGIHMSKNDDTGASKRISGYLSLNTAKPDPVYIRNYQLNKILIKTISDFCKEKGVKLMLVVLDTEVYIPEVERKLVAIDPTFNANFFEDDLRNYARLLNVEYLGLQRIFRKTYEDAGIPLHWAHWNYEGHRVVADALTDKLKSIIFKKQGE